MRREIAQQFHEELKFEFLEPRFGAQNLAFEFFQRRRGETFGAKQGLLALVISRYAIEVRLGYFDVVTENLVEPDLERGNRGALAFGGLEPRDHAARVERERAQFINFGAEARADHIAVARVHRWLVAYRGVDLRDQLRLWLHPCRKLTNDADAAGQPLEITDTLQRFCRLAAQVGF